MKIEKSLGKKTDHGTNDTFSIKQISEKIGLTEDALRYYEKLGLLPPAKRKENGHRIYRMEDTEVMELIICLKKIGVPLKDIKTYASLSFKEDITTVPELQAAFQAYRQQVQAQIEELQHVLQVIDYKLNNNQSLLRGSGEQNNPIG